MPQDRSPILDLSPAEFRKIGHQLIDDIADFLGSLPEKRVNPAQSPKEVREILGDGGLPIQGTDPKKLLKEAAAMMFNHSLFNGHPAFFGYITSSAAPIGALGDLLATSVNPNVGSFQLAPLATEIESQTVRWIAELIGYPPDCGGLLVSGGNMANFVCFLAGRKSKIPWDVRKEGAWKGGRVRIYCSSETHTWVNKAADLFGFGTDAIRWISADEGLRMRTDELESQIERDHDAGELPLMVIGTAGSVSTGAVDPIVEIASICRKHNLWFHIDGAYGGFAAAVPDASDDLRSFHLADSIAVDPHKWLYAPLEAGCALVRDASVLHDSFSYHPAYYMFARHADEQPTNFYEYGPQNSRGFRALKVWLGLRQAGREGYRRMISSDIALAKSMYEEASKTPGIEVFTNDLSITTFRYVPESIVPGLAETEKYLNRLNEETLLRLQQGGEAFLSNAVIRGSFVLRACVVNFRTTLKHVQMVPRMVARIGKEVHEELRQEAPASVS